MTYSVGNTESVKGMWTETEKSFFFVLSYHLHVFHSFSMFYVFMSSIQQCQVPQMTTQVFVRFRSLNHTLCTEVTRQADMTDMYWK